MDANELWEQGVPHEKESEKLVRLLRELESEQSGYSDLFECGGDGDTGEEIMYFLDILLRTGKVRISF